MTTFTSKSTGLALAMIAAAAITVEAAAQGYTIRAETAPQPATQAQAPQPQPATSTRTDIRDFRFVNTSSAVIQGAWISLSNPRAPWLRIELSSPIGPNGTREIGMSGWSGSQCHFDVKVEFDNGRSALWKNVNLCRVTNLST